VNQSQTKVKEEVQKTKEGAQRDVDSKTNQPEKELSKENLKLISKKSSKSERLKKQKNELIVSLKKLTNRLTAKP
jgi:hypothetical protein